MKMQPALPTQSTGKVKTELQTHSRVSTVCLKNTHPQKSTPLPQEISELSPVPISARLMEFLNIACAKPYFRFFLIASSAVWLLLLQICRERIRSASQRSLRTLCSFLSKGRPGSSEVGGASAASAHRLHRNLALIHPSRLQLSGEPARKEKQQLQSQAGAFSLRDVIFPIFLLHLVDLSLTCLITGVFPKASPSCAQHLWEQHKGWKG